MTSINEQEDQSIIDYLGDENFLEEVFELAFGDDALNKEYTNAEVLVKLREFSDKALLWDNSQEIK